MTKVYPRVCGGTGGAGKADEVVLGLSPRVRGNPRAMSGRSAPARSIPACAGEPVGRQASPRLVSVYPRVCGGTAPVRLPGGYYDGLSPRVRGNLDEGSAAPAAIGSIPACAGEP